MAKLRITDYLTELKTEAAGLRSACGPEALDRVAPSRPDSTVAGILLELAREYRWAVDALFTRPTADQDLPQPPPVTAQGTAVLDAYDHALAAVLDAIEARGADSPAWTWAPVEWRAEFWHRRVAVATGLARWDVQMAVGATAPVPVALAAEAISEVFEAFLPVGARRGAHPEASGLVQLFAQDADATWFVRLREGRVALLDQPDSRTELQARAAGSASDIALALWGRLPFGICDVAGDEGLLQAMRVE
ncbi:hypothetical protein [Glycomyces algeriensis]|jgi:hypothetical protein|uniref:Mycothiol maleylpyruvate isomerase-like protein n=1 Tax=Glycomyces algeriensis TaxID=256037 RepID=A0A9W6G534_9ACTN|nr:hypothetical protein [Glycomyces algeriensis]MDA1367641.1 hypothetical protein [Glycomyces algeriensis]MDR7352982.1 hypothetical protein [Glycomyces algeriensis]GLI40671.1 hypothetical protein GALLR39Z86_05210 [Glycomyces algeriensis]